MAECPEYQFGAAAAFGTCRSSAGKTGSCPVWSKHPVLHQRGQRYSDSGGQGWKSCRIGPGCWGHGNGCVCHGWREDRGPLVIPALYPSSPGFVVGPVITCLGSGLVQYASRSVAGQCVSSASGVVPPRHADSVPLNDKKGEVLKTPWVVLLRKDPAPCRPLQAIGHMWYPPVEARPRQEWEILLSLFLRMSLSRLKVWSRHSSSSRMS